ncbi:MAG: hypothetical protein R2911_40585 [Caldilineaceae bacterium]
MTNASASVICWPAANAAAKAAAYNGLHDCQRFIHRARMGPPR